MANFPAANFYQQSRNKNSSTVIINGRRVPVGEGLYGRDIANMAGGPGRRPVLIEKGKTTPLDQNHFYTPGELMNNHGESFKISSIPDRTKGGFPGTAERVLVFLDFANIDAGGRSYADVHYGDLLSYLAEGRFLVEAYAYVPIDPRQVEARRGLVHHLQENGWMVFEKLGKIAGNTYKSNVDVEMCIDIMRSAQQIHPDILVICSGDGDFLPVVRELRRMGIRTEVASFEEAADTTLRREASGFISLDVWQNEVSVNKPAFEEESSWNDEEAESDDPGKSLAEPEPISQEYIPETRASSSLS